MNNSETKKLEDLNVRIDIIKQYICKFVNINKYVNHLTLSNGSFSIEMLLLSKSL